MTINELVALAGESPTLIAIALAAPPALAALTLLAGRDPIGRSPTRYLFAVLVYLVCVPGMLAAVITGYTFFFQNADLREVDALVYFGPIGAMVLTLILIGRRTPLSRVPGFGQIGGLMVLLGVSFAVALVLQRLRVWVVFGGGLGALLLLGVGVFVVLRVATRRVFGQPAKPDAP